MVLSSSLPVSVCAGVLLLFSGANALSLPSPKTSALLRNPTSSSSSPLNAIALPLDEKHSQLSTPFKEKDNDDLAWARNLDYQAFAKDVTELGKQLQAESGEKDVKHLNKILLWRDLSAALGILTMALPPNPISVAALSTWTYASWTMIAHHTCHGGYNRLDAGKFNSRKFAIGLRRRFSDWCDWMLPEAWNIEHNRLHHYHLSEDKDPDLVERNMAFLRGVNVPMWVKYGVVGLLMPIWKWSYYAPNTYKELQVNKWRAEGRKLPENFDQHMSMTLTTLLFPTTDSERAAAEVVKPDKFLKKVVGPFFLTRFVLLPLPLMALPLIPGLGFLSGPNMVQNAVINLILAELLTNIHAFITIVTNHAGNDLYTFENSVKPKTGSFYVRQIVSSANYAYGNDVLDFSHGWLNYQIEHHVWPDLSMLGYQRGAPQLRKICEKHGVPYVKESVWTRLRKTVDIMVGKNSMKPFPAGIEPAADKMN